METSHGYRRRRERCAFHFKIDETLSAEHLTAYRTLIEASATTTDLAHAWLAEQGYRLSRSAVARHRRRHLEAGRRGREAGEAARAFAAGTASMAGGTLARGILVKAGQILFDRLMEPAAVERMDWAELREIARAVGEMVRAEAAMGALAGGLS